MDIMKIIGFLTWLNPIQPVMAGNPDAKQIIRDSSHLHSWSTTISMLWKKYASTLPEETEERSADQLLEDMKYGRSDFHLMLDLSTGHVSEQTNNLLNRRAGDPKPNTAEDREIPVRWIPHTYGYIFWPTEPDEDQDWSNAPELEAINKFAFESGCMLVKFDQDAGANERFPEFEW